MKEWILPTFGTFICWGLWSFIPKVTLRYIDPKSAIIYEVLGGIIFAIVVLYCLDFRIETHSRGILLAVTTGVLGFIGAFCFLFAVSTGPVTLIAPISALYPVVSVIMAIIFFEETLTLRQVVGIAFAFLAIILIVSDTNDAFNLWK